MNGVPYTQGKSAPLLANMYVPKGVSMAPAIIFIHGGGWTAGTRDFSDKVIVPLIEHGYVGMTIDYDLSPGVRFPIALEECKAAVRWLRAHAAEYHVDPDRIAVAGYSAGGELAALVALTGDDPRYDGIGDFTTLSSRVKAAILWSSDLDLTTFSEKDQSITAYLGGSCSEHKDLCLQASPQHNLGGKLPPIFIGHGNADEDVPYPQFTNFVAAYKLAHGSITTFTAEQGQHDYVVQPKWFRASMDATLNFLKKNL
ncbi:alpha/beta hydrolase [Granulicella sp. dw_53]|uniref:alpha/beta hydrolase n=1 Tax=Granulicella sp. dw_53 TaxID=2719792 RepID=UPI0031F65EC7